MGTILILWGEGFSLNSKSCVHNEIKPDNSDRIIEINTFLSYYGIDFV